MLQSRLFPKLSTALALAVCFAAPAAADTRSDLSGRLDRLEQDVAHAQSAMQVAQSYNRPPADVPESGYGGGGPDAAGLDVRVDRLENQMRTLNGQIEQMQFDIHRLDDELRKFQQDVDFRFQDGGRGGAPAQAPARPAQHHSELEDQISPAAPAEPSAPTFGAPGRGTKGADAFDPSSDPNAPGAPRIIGAVRADSDAENDAGEPPVIAAPDAAAPRPLPQGPIGLETRDPNAPLELPSAPHVSAAPVYASTPAPPAPLQPSTIGGTAAQPGGVRTPPPGNTQLASLPSSTPRDEFDAAAAALKGEQYDTAENGFKTFVAKHPKDKLVPDAVFYLGESYFQRSRYREAAEQYLKISTDYSKTAKAPDSLLRLGQALDKLGAKEQACAAFAEVGRKYPTAASSLRVTADREAKRVQC